nr:type I methionyl aminopeptidase [Candidatus Comchoanobacter bicostacola]
MNTDHLIKSQSEIEKMRQAGRAAAQVLDYLTPHVQAGISTSALNDLAHDYITNTLNCIPAPLNYKGFPKSICTSVNHVVCHGIPDDKKLKNGDIINIDITVIKDGWHGDTSKMFLIGQCPAHAIRLCKVAQECMHVGINRVKPGVSLYEIGYAIEQYAKKNYCSSVHEFCGHGIGRDFHEKNFQVLHYGDPDLKSFILREGMTFTIEPMINLGKRHIKILNDEWTVVTKDKSLSAQWEHTLLVTHDGVEILTLRTEEQ